jgi:hypothetical protein
MYAARAGVGTKDWRKIIDNLKEPDNRRLYDLGRGMTPEGEVGYPMQISIAEPTKIGG